jgi:hypothetical protein
MFKSVSAHAAIMSVFLFAPLSALADDIQNLNLKGQIKQPGQSASATGVPDNTTQHATDNQSVPQDATMNQDMLLVAPPQKSTIEKNVPYEGINQSLIELKILKSDIDFEKVRGLQIMVINNSNKPVVIDGDKASVMIGNTKTVCVPVEFIQRMIIPPHKLSQDVIDLITKVAPAAASIGALPTIQDIRRSQKPILERYGADEVRRKIEFTRFGRRIIWTHQEVSGILYFNTKEELAGTKLDVPMSLLFSPKDTSSISAIAPPAVKSTVRAQAPETSSTPNAKSVPSSPATN